MLDADTGKVLTGLVDEKRRSNERTVPPTRHLISLGGDKLYGLMSVGKKGETEQKGVMYVYGLDGKKLAENSLPLAAVEAEKQKQIEQTEGRSHWQNFSYSCAYTIAGSRIYIRSNDHLWCVGQK